MTNSAPDQGAEVPAKVLVVDDDESVRALVEFHFRNAPWETQFVHDGDGAVEAFRSGSWGLVLMDLEMPGMGGVETARLLRSLEAETGRDATPIVAMSADAGDGTPMDEAFTGALAKPFSRKGITALVERVLGLNGKAVSTSSSAAISKAGNTDPALQPLLPKLFASVAELAADAAAGLEFDDMPMVAKAGHKIRGATSCFGVDNLADAAKRLERSARAGDKDAARTALDGITAILHGKTP